MLKVLQKQLMKLRKQLASWRILRPFRSFLLPFWLVLEKPIRLPFTLVRRARAASLALYYLASLSKERREPLRPAPPADCSPRIVMLVNSNLSADPRVKREAMALADAGFAVTIICPLWSQNDLDVPLEWGPNISFRLLPFTTGWYSGAFPWCFEEEVFGELLKEEAWAYHGHDLDTALMVLAAARKKQAACVCDFHEWYSENVSFSQRTQTFYPHRFYKRLWYRRLEQLVIHRATEVVTVCQSIADLMERVYCARRPIHVIRNIPSLDQIAQDAPPLHLRDALGLRPDTRIVLYQGGVGPSRNLEPVIQAMAQVRNAALVIRGPGIREQQERYLKLARRAGANGRVFCLPPVSADRVVAEARAADMGLWTLLSNVGLNFRLALPNKLFEYLAAGVPVLGADLPEARKLIHGYQVGETFDPDDPNSIAAAIGRLADPLRLQVCRSNIPSAMKDLRADVEWDKLVQLYKRILKDAAPEAERVTRSSRKAG